MKSDLNLILKRRFQVPDYIQNLSRPGLDNSTHD